MNEIRKPFSDVLSEEQIRDLYAKCNYDKNNEDLYFECNDFINGFALILYGERDIEFGTDYSDIIDTNGNFIDILLDKNIKYSNGKIVKLKDDDKGSYFYKISRIHENKYKNDNFSSSIETAFFVIKVTRYSNKRDEDTLDLYYVINPKLDVIATFADTNTWGNEFDGYKNCNVYTERDFFFINEEREFLIFSQKLIANSEEDGFVDKHLAGLDPIAYEDIMREYDPGFEGDVFFRDFYRLNCTFNEEDFDEETMREVIAKYNGELDEEDEEYDEIPNVGDIHFFFEDTTNELYKDVFKEYYNTLYGIIDCKIKSTKQLLPFTDYFTKARGIIEARYWQEKEESQGDSWYGRGWSFDNKYFRGHILNSKFFDYPSRVKGFTLKYIYKFYPDELKWMSEHGLILIPNHLLDTLGNNELTRYIRLNQEIHLSYSKIQSTSDCLNSTEYYGVISSYQGKQLHQIIYTKGGTKYLIGLLKSGNLEIDKNVLEDLSKNAFNDIEERCYRILISVIDNIELEKERYNDWVQRQIDEDNIREANRQFNDMMNDFDAWGNID